jgi:anti-anti-sigma factor
MNLQITLDEGEVVLVDCHGDIRRDDPRDVFEELLGPRCYSRCVIVRLAEARFIDSSGIGWLVVSHRRFRKAGGRLILHSLPKQVDDALHFVRTHDFLTIVGNEVDARTLAAAGDT